MGIFPDYVVTRVPHRITFCGGGSDFPDFNLNHSGAVLTTSINKFVYVSTSSHSQTFKERFRIHYSEIELCNNVGEIRNSIIRECLKYAQSNWGDIKGLTISTTSDVPSSSGLGSSSAFCVGLLLNLATRFGVDIDKYSLAKLACEIEIEKLGKPIGKQDQFATATGGFNLLEFTSSYETKITPIKVDILENILSGHVLLISSGLYRSADEILKHQYRPNSSQIELLKQMVSHTYEVYEKLKNEKSPDIFLSELTNSVNIQTSLKLKLNKNIIPVNIYSPYKILQDELFNAVKINGAGGGGFFTGLSLNKLTQQFMNKVTNQTGLLVENVNCDSNGATVLYKGSNGNEDF